MTLESPEEKNYMLELYNMTKGDITAKVSMYEVGEGLGMDKNSAGRMAEDLIASGLVELMTLSGGIGINEQGLAALDIPMPTSSNSDTKLQLGDGPIISESDKKSVEQLLTELRTGISSKSPAYARLEELVIDIKTLETQLLSPQPKIAIIREILRSLEKNVAAMGLTSLAGTIKAM